MKDYFLALPRLALVAAALFGVVAPSLAQPPKELRIPSDRKRPIEEKYPLGPTWQAFDPEEDALRNPQHFGFERVDDFKNPLRGVVRPIEDGCFINDSSRVYDGPRHYEGTAEEHFRGKGGVAIVRVLSVTPGVAMDFASALEVELVEKVSVRGGAGPFPRYILYPAVSFELDGETFCLREKGFPPVPKPGDELAVSIRTRTFGPTSELLHAGLLVYDNFIMNLDADGPKAPRHQWDALPAAVRGSSKGQLKAWVRSVAKGGNQ